MIQSQNNEILSTNKSIAETNRNVDTVNTTAANTILQNQVFRISLNLFKRQQYKHKQYLLEDKLGQIM